LSAEDDRMGLVRRIGRWDLTALAINAIIGAGIFGLPSKTYALVGGWSLIAFVLCAMLVLLIVLCFAEVGSRFRDSGGPYLYASTAFGPWVGFGVGWLTWLARVSSIAALANLFASYFAWFVPGADTGVPRAALLSGLLLVLACLNIIGVGAATRAGNGLTIGKLVPLVLFIGVGAFAVDPSRLAPGPMPGSNDLSQAVLLLVFAFTGFESAVISAAEMRAPERHLPFALLSATFVVALVYIGVQFVCIGSLPGLATSERPLADAAFAFSGAWGAGVITLGALLSIAGNVNASVLAAPRLLYAMAERGQLPRALMAVHARFRTPHVAIAVNVAVALAATLSGTFLVLLVISTLSRLITYGITCAALVQLRRRPDAPPSAFRVRAGGLVATLAIALSAWLALHATWVEARAVLVALAVGIAVLLAHRLARR
jgi:amino acid transporter